MLRLPGRKKKSKKKAETPSRSKEDESLKATLTESGMLAQFRPSTLRESGSVQIRQRTSSILSLVSNVSGGSYHTHLSGASLKSSVHVPSRFAVHGQDDILKDILEKLTQLDKKFESYNESLTTRIGDLEEKYKCLQQQRGTNTRTMGLNTLPDLIEDKEEVDEKPSKDPSEKHYYGSGFYKEVVSRASKLSAVPETEDHNFHNGSHSELSGSAISHTDSRVAALEEKVDILSKAVGHLELKTELRPFKGTQSYLGTPESFRGRGKSEGEKAMIKRKPRLGTIKKAFSAEDVHGVTTEVELLRSYSPVSSLHTERNKEIKEDSKKQGSVSSMNASSTVNQDRPEWLTETCKITDTDMENVLQREDSLTHSCETQILLPTFIDPHNTREYIPTCFTPVATLSPCTHDSRDYYNKHNDLGLEIPAGAISEGESITIDIGVALYGPFQYPEGLRPVSPVFWVCVRDQKYFQFLKPVKVTIPHCLNLESHDDIESLGVTFLKGDHEIYQFQQAEGDVHFEPLKNYGVIEITHFCSLCISCKETPKSFEKAKFCLYSVIPCVVSPDQPSFAFFFITFLLETCLTTVKGQMESLKLQNYEQKAEEFQFRAKRPKFQTSHMKALEIHLPKSDSLPTGWMVGMQGKKKILMSDIDFFVRDRNAKEQLQLKEKIKIYPPRFQVKISCSPSAQQSQIKIEFRGAVTDLVFDILLTPTPASITPTSIEPQVSDVSSTRPPASRDPPSLPDLLQLKVPQQVGAHYKPFGILLLNDDTGCRVDAIKGASPSDIVISILQEWIAGRGRPRTWQALIETQIMLGTT